MSRLLQTYGSTTLTYLDLLRGLQAMAIFATAYAHPVSGNWEA